MEKEKRIVKPLNSEGRGENNLAEENHSDRFKSRLPSGLMILATLATLSPWNNVKAEKPDSYIPPHPLRQTGRLQPTKQESTLVIPEKEQSPMTTQESPESYHIEETDPFSQQGKLENFVANYIFMDANEKKIIKERIIIHESGASLLCTFRTILPFIKSEDNLKTFVKNVNLPPLQKDSFVIIDDNPTFGKYELVIFDFPLKQYKNDYSKVPENERKYMEKLDKYPYITTTLWIDGKPITINPSQNVELLSRVNPPFKTRLNPFEFHPAYDMQKQQIVLTNNLIAQAFYDPHNIQTISLDKGKTTTAIMNPIAYPFNETVLYGDSESRMKENLKGFLLTMPYIFSNTAEVDRYIATGDKSKLRYIALYPQDHPAFFSPINSGEASLNRPLTLHAMNEAVSLIDQAGPDAIDSLVKLGLRAVLSKEDLPINYLATFDYIKGIIFIDEAKLTRNPIKRITSKGIERDSSTVVPLTISTILIESAGIGYNNYFINSSRLPPSFNHHYMQGIWKSEFERRFAVTYQDKLSPDLYDYLIQDALFVLTSYFNNAHLYNNSNFTGYTN